MKAPEFVNRWRIEGRLTTVSPLHMGDGQSGSLADRSVPAQSTEDAEVQTVCVDWRGKPVIPGSSLKGVLRGLAAVGSRDLASCWIGLLGSLDADSKGAVGGKLEFWDAPLLADVLQDPESPPGPYFVPNRQTCVATSVSLDRRTRTAKEHLLYQVEYVPPGASFRVQITGDNLDEDEVVELIALLESVEQDSARATLGAGATHGWGRWSWESTDIARFTREDLRNALTHGRVSSCGYDLCSPLEGKDLEAIVRQVAAKRLQHASPGERLVLPVRLAFAGPLLIRDPSVANEAKVPSCPDGSDALVEREHSAPQRAVPVVDEHGAPMIPGSSMRGALRAQAERILRTLGCPTLDPVSRLFGVPGWKAPLTVHRFTSTDFGQGDTKHRRLVQEFVAIDRFTGGAADKKKYAAEAFVGVKLEGQLELDLTRARGSCEDYALGLLLLVLRDVAEGDVRFGSGDAKGYGVCSELQVQWEGRWQRLDALGANEQIESSLEALRRLPRQHVKKMGQSDG